MKARALRELICAVVCFSLLGCNDSASNDTLPGQVLEVSVDSPSSEVVDVSSPKPSSSPDPSSPPVGCDGEPSSGLALDSCGVCGGTNACLGCDGITLSFKVPDACGICGGDGSSCTGTGTEDPPSPTVTSKPFELLITGTEKDEFGVAVDMFCPDALLQTEMLMPNAGLGECGVPEGTQADVTISSGAAAGSGPYPTFFFKPPTGLLDLPYFWVTMGGYTQSSYSTPEPLTWFTDPTPTSVTIFPGGMLIPLKPGSSLPLTAILRDSDGVTTDISTTAIWTSSVNGVTVDAFGVVTASSAFNGEVEIMALDSASGLSGSLSVFVLGGQCESEPCVFYVGDPNDWLSWVLE